MQPFKEEILNIKEIFGQKFAGEIFLRWDVGKSDELILNRT